jgi:type IV pilus assembly protein PilC
MLYAYIARGGDGTRCSGTIEADSVESAAAHLRARSLLITSLERLRIAGKAAHFVGGQFGSVRRARSIFLRSFAVLIRGGVAIRRALDSLAQQASPTAFAETLRSISADVDAGEQLSTALARHPDAFNRIVVEMVRAGELGGTIDDALLRIATLQEAQSALQKRLIAALTYPAFVGIASLALVLFLVAQTMPAFNAIFAEMHVRLPLSTRLLIWLGNRLSHPAGWALLLVPVAAVASLVLLVRSRFGRSAIALERLVFKLPVIGIILRRALVAAFCRTLAALLACGVAMVPALEHASAPLWSAVYRAGLERAIDSLRSGNSLYTPLRDSNLFEPLLLQLIRTGEESGALDGLLDHAAGFYELEVEMALASMVAMVEPALICLLGALIGTVVASIIIPLYAMIGSMN